MSMEEESYSPGKKVKGIGLIDYETRKDMFLGNKVT